MHPCRGFFQAVFHYCETSTRTLIVLCTGPSPRSITFLVHQAFTFAAWHALFLPAPSGSASLRPFGSGRRTHRLGQPSYCALPIVTFRGRGRGLGPRCLESATLPLKMGERRHGTLSLPRQSRLLCIMTFKRGLYRSLVVPVHTLLMRG